MKYTYIICLALSSFFTYKQLIADTNTNLNAFFIPGGAFQKNTQTIDIQKMKPRYSQETYATPRHVNSGDTTQSNVKPSSAATVAKKTAETPQRTQTKKQTQTAQKTTTPQAKSPSSPAAPKADKSSAEPTIAYTEKKETPKAISQPETTTPPIETQLSELEKFEKKSMKEMLNTIPSPDFTLPKYQQIYALYGLELRSAYRRGSLPANYEQEATLAKANSIRRVPVK